MFYVGLLGAIIIEPIVSRLAISIHSLALCLAVFHYKSSLASLGTFIGLVSRSSCGRLVAGIFVVVESWLLQGSPRARAKRLGLYMAALYGGSAIGQLGIKLWMSVGICLFSSLASWFAHLLLLFYLDDADQPQSEYIAHLTAAVPQQLLPLLAA